MSSLKRHLRYRYNQMRDLFEVSLRRKWFGTFWTDNFISLFLSIVVHLIQSINDTFFKSVIAHFPRHSRILCYCNSLRTGQSDLKSNTFTCLLTSLNSQRILLSSTVCQKTLIIQMRSLRICSIHINYYLKIFQRFLCN